jgi:hypothetical protein
MFLERAGPTAGALLDGEIMKVKFIKCTEFQATEIARRHPDLLDLTTPEVTANTCVIIDDFHGIIPRVDNDPKSTNFGVLTCSLDYFLDNYHSIRQAEFLSLSSKRSS